MKKYLNILLLVTLVLPSLASAETSGRSQLLALLQLIATKHPQPALSIMVGPIIQELSGPTTVKVNENGQWTIVVKEAHNSALTHRVDWGDGVANYTLAPIPLFDQGQQVITFNHTYLRVGTLEIKATATNKTGQSAGASIVVTANQH